MVRLYGRSWRYWLYRTLQSQMHQCCKVQTHQKFPEGLQGHMVITYSRVGGHLHQLLEQEHPKLRSYASSKVCRRGSSRISQVPCKAVAKTGSEVDTSRTRTAQSLWGGRKSELGRERRYSAWRTMRQSILTQQGPRGPATMEMALLSSLHPVSRRRGADCSRCRWSKGKESALPGCAQGCSGEIAREAPLWQGFLAL